MKIPKSLKELIEYLSASPKVTMQIQELPPSPRLFIEFARGAFYWKDQHERISFTPLSCQHTKSETALSFTDTGFVFEKFGIQMNFTYLEES